MPTIPRSRRVAATRRPRAASTGSALRVAVAVLVLATTAVAQPIWAHDLGFTRTLALLLPDNAFRIDLQIDLDALALGVSQDTDNAELAAALDALSPEELEQVTENLRQTLLRRIRVRVDGEPLSPEVSFPDAGTVEARRQQTVLGLVARLSGRLPAAAVDVSLQVSRAFPPLHITFVDARNRPDAAARLDDLLRLAPADVDEVVDRQMADRIGDLPTQRQILERGDRSDPYRLDQPPPEAGRFEVFGQYLRLGFEHILPLGIDHIMFVLGLFLLNTAWRPLLAQVTAFTAAHTLTLALSTYGVVSLSPAIVEPLIALSIAWIAFENVLTSELRWWRPAVVFGFGLLHGLGFAGVLMELGLPRGEYLTALLSFNAGVELGQLAVIVLAFLALGAFRQRSWYRSRVTVPLSLIIGMVGLYWAFQRTFLA